MKASGPPGHNTQAPASSFIIRYLISPSLHAAQEN